MSTPSLLMAGSGAPHARVLWIALGATLCALQLAATITIKLDWDRTHLVLLLLGAVPWAGAIWVVLTRSPAGAMPIIIVTAVVLRLAVLFLGPLHSTDIYRYVWEGRIQAAGFSPYLHVPADEALAALRDDAIWPNINRAGYAPTIYPPVSQILFLLATRVSESILWMKIVLVLFEGVAAWAVLRLLALDNLPLERLAIYAWCPLPVWEFANGGHIDAAMMAFSLLALLAVRYGRPALSGTALAAAVLVKFMPIAIVPALMPRRDWRLPLACGVTIVAAYMVYGVGAGTRVLGFLPTYAGEEGISDGSGFWLLSALRRLGIGADATTFIVLAGLVLLALGVAVWWRSPKPNAADVLLLGTALTLVISPQYPWYLVWLLPFACLAPNWAVLWLVGSGPLLYWDGFRTEHWIGDVVFGGALVLLIAQALMASVRTHVKLKPRVQLVAEPESTSA